MMTMSEYVSLKEVLYGPRKVQDLDYYITLSKRVIMVTFWALDLFVLLNRIGFFKCHSSCLTRPQMYIYIVNLILSLTLHIRRYLSADAAIMKRRITLSSEKKGAEESTLFETDKEILAATNKKRDIIFALFKVAFDMLSAVQGSGIWEFLFHSSINEALVSVGSIMSAFISLRTLFLGHH